MWIGNSISFGPINSVHAEITLGPGAANLRASGEDVKVIGQPGTGVANSCESRFVPFPVAVSQKVKN